MTSQEAIAKFLEKIRAAQAAKAQPKEEVKEEVKEEAPVVEEPKKKRGRPAKKVTEETAE